MRCQGLVAYCSRRAVVLLACCAACSPTTATHAAADVSAKADADAVADVIDTVALADVPDAPDVLPDTPAEMDATDSSDEPDTPAAGAFGQPCYNGSCDNGYCFTYAGNSNFCTVSCTDKCPSGWHCAPHAPLDNVCWPDAAPETGGLLCSSDAECLGGFCAYGACSKLCTGDAECAGIGICLAVTAGKAICLSTSLAGDLAVPCQSGFECDSGMCVLWVDGTKRCTRTCLTDCPYGLSCLPIANSFGFYCLPYQPKDFLCAPCDSDWQCAGGTCLPGTQTNGYFEGSFCATSCMADAECPTGYACSGVPYPGGQGNCVPKSGTCTCSVALQAMGVTTMCSRVNGSGKCLGSVGCVGSALSLCDAATPTDEVCNGKDDNCNGATDEGLKCP